MSDNLPVKASETSALAKTIEYGEAGIVIRTVDDLKNLAKWSVESGFLPEQIKTAQQAFVIMVSGAELGLKPMAAVKFLYLTKARRVALMTKGALAVVQSKPTFGGYREWIEGEGKTMKACAWAQRKGMEGLTKEFSYEDAEVAGLLRERKTREGQSYDSTYQAYLKDMLLSRARGRVLDIVFAAELGGIPIEGVAEDIDMMDRRSRGAENATVVGSSEPRPHRHDPLLDVIAIQQEKNDLDNLKHDTNLGAARPPEMLDPSLVKVIDAQVEEVFGPSENEPGPPPAVKAEPSPPAAGVGTRQPGKGKAGGASMPGGPLPGMEVCPRCAAKLNPMGGCDVCGWPGPDLR